MYSIHVFSFNCCFITFFRHPFLRKYQLKLLYQEECMKKYQTKQAGRSYHVLNNGVWLSKSNFRDYKFYVDSSLNLTYNNDNIRFYKAARSLPKDHKYFIIYAKYYDGTHSQISEPQRAPQTVHWSPCIYLAKLT